MEKKNKFLSENQIIEVLDKLDEAYPDAGCALNFDTEFHLLVAVVLSAQTTDASVNTVTPILFDRYPTPSDLAEANLSDVEDIIRKIGLYKNKSKNIVALSAKLRDDFDSKVPNTFDDLLKLPGVGRKTANVVLAEAFGEQKIAVDTHVFRVSNRIGLACSDDVLETEKQLMNNLPNNRWTRAHHLLIFHGRRCCTARKPNCSECPIGNICIDKNNNNC